MEIGSGDRRAGRAGALLAALVVNELRRSDPVLPLSIFKIKGLAATNAAQVVHAPRPLISARAVIATGGLYWLSAHAVPDALAGSLHGQAFGGHSASKGTVCVSSAEEKEP
jgi:hypothetical protein